VVKLWREAPQHPRFVLTKSFPWGEPPSAPYPPFYTPPVVWGPGYPPAYRSGFSGTPGDPGRSLDVVCGGAQSSSGPIGLLQGAAGQLGPIGPCGADIGENSFSCSCSNSPGLADGFSSVDTSNLSLSDGLKGATVEGSTSQQVFNDTVWLGDYGSPLVFKFQLHGIEETKQGNFCPACGIRRKNSNNFCPNCGAKQ
jgi:hypothetical protein